MIDEKVSQLPATTLPLNTDSLLYVSEDDGAGNYTSKKIKVSDFLVGGGAWAALALNANWTEVGAPDSPALYLNDGSNVSVRGKLSYDITTGGSGANKVISTLPVGSRPSKPIRFVCFYAYSMSGTFTGFTSNINATVEVQTNGDIVLLNVSSAGGSATAVQIDLSPIQFPIA
jgi:hypothetical protein